MTTGFEGPAFKAVMDALVGLYKKAKTRSLTSKGKAALSDAMCELLMAPSDQRSAEAKLRLAKAAGILNVIKGSGLDLIGKLAHHGYAQ